MCPVVRTDSEVLAEVCLHGVLQAEDRGWGGRFQRHASQGESVARPLH